jgi:hypothetical protein
MTEVDELPVQAQQVSVGGILCTVRVLTVGELRAALARLAVRMEGESQQDNAINSALFDDVSIAELCRLTDLSPVAVEGLRPVQLRPLIDALKLANPTYFEARARLLARGAAVLASLSPSERARAMATDG